MLGDCTHEDTHTQCTVCARSHVMHCQYTADYAMAYNIMKFIANSYSSAFLFELIGWAYFRVINDPLQQHVAKKGGGRIFERLQ